MPQKKLSDVCEEIVDCLHETAPTQDEGIPSICTSDIENGRLDIAAADRVSEDVYQKWTQRSEPQPGDIILAREAPVGEVGIVPQGTKVCLGQRTVQLRPDRSKVVPRYLLFLFLDRELQNRMESMAAGSTVAHLNLSDIREMELPDLPPLPVQRRIADILGALDDKIDLNRRMNETLEETAQALYRHCFVDFGPFQDREFTDTEELGPIPKGWEVAPLETIVNIELDNIDPQDHPEEEFDYYSFSAYDEDRYPEIEVGGEIGSRKSLVKRRKVMVSRLNPGDYRIWTVHPGGERKGITSTEFIHFVPVRESLWGYLNCHLRSEGFKAEFRRHASGTTGSRQRVRRRTPNEFKTAIPPETVLNEFGEKVNPIWDLIHSNRKENQQLSETRDYLLPKLISGEIEVDTAQEVAEDAVNISA